MLTLHLCIITVGQNAETHAQNLGAPAWIIQVLMLNCPNLLILNILKILSKNELNKLGFPLMKHSDANITAKNRVI